MTFLSTLKFNINSNMLNNWFWEHYNENNENISIWIGKSVYGLKIPEDHDNYLNEIMKHMKYKDMYIKFYLTRNLYSKEYNMNCIIICENVNGLPKEFKYSLISSIFEIYEITDNMLKNNSKFKEIISYYLKWNNMYPNYSFIKEIDNIESL